MKVSSLSPELAQEQTQPGNQVESSWQKRLLVIVPAYNEEKSVGHVIDQIKQTCPDVDILVVDDGSEDVTRRVARDHGSKVLRLRRNSGIGVAMKAGYRYAVRRGHRYAVQVDADGQHDPKFIESMIRPLLAEECDLVIGSRFLENRGFVSSWQRRIGIRFFSFLLFLLTRQWVSDPTSGNRAMNRKSLELFAVDYPFDYPEPESLLTLIQRGLRIKEVPIRMDPRRAGKSSISIERAFYYMIKVTLAILFRFFKPRPTASP